MQKSYQFFMFLIMLCGSIYAGAQEPLIQESSKTFEALNSEEQYMYNKILENGLYSEHYLVEYGSLQQMQLEGEIRIKLPGDDCDELLFQAKSVQFESDESYVWYGVLKAQVTDEDCFCRLGAITLVASPTGKIGHITVDEKTYEILELSPETYVAAKVDDEQFTVACPNHGDELDEFSPNTLDRSGGNGNCDVRCLVLFTPAAETFEGSLAAINNRVNLAIAQTNQSFRNSDIAACELRLELAGVEPLAFIETTDSEVDVTRLANDLNAQQLRNDFEADIVMLLTGGIYLDALGRVDSIGPSEADAYAVVETGTATTARLTFAHEVGHLFGARHYNDPDPGTAHAEQFKTGNFLPCIFGEKQYTILNTIPNQAVIQHYSNPDVTFDGKKTGTTSYRNNAGMIKQNACTVADFRQTVLPYSMYVTGDLFMCPCTGASLQASIGGGSANATYTFVWSQSTDGITFTNLPYTGSGAVVMTPCVVGDGVFVRAECTDNNGATTTSQVFVEAATTWPGQQAPCMAFLSSENNNSDTGISISPNPASEEQTITIEIPTEGKYSIVLKDINGKVLQTLAKNQYFEVGTQIFTTNIAYKGLVIVQCNDDKGQIRADKLIRQ